MPGLALGNLPVRERKAACGTLSGGLVKGVRWDVNLWAAVHDGLALPIARKLLTIWPTDQQETTDKLEPLCDDESCPVPNAADQVWVLAPVSSGGSMNLTFSSVTTRSLTSSTPSRWQ